MHGGPRLSGDRLGHEGGKTIVAQGGLTDQAFEVENVIGQTDRIAMGKVQLDLCLLYTSRCV